jgi:cytochrome c biogenesis factor
MTMHHYREDFSQRAPEKSFEEEIVRQHLAVARDANEIARSAAYAASAAAAAARLLAYIAMAALIMAVSALVVSIVTPDKIRSYLAEQSSWSLPTR